MKKLTNFRNRYAGLRCFILANGASLNDTPLELLKDDVSFGMNMISLIFDRTIWRPTFMVLTTSAVTDERYKEIILKGIQASDRAFIWDRFQNDSEFKSMPNITFIPVIHDGPVTTKEATNKFWPEDITQGVSKFATTTFAALQIAVFMGFNPIYLVGVDLDWKPFKDNDINHFHPDYNSKSLTKQRYTGITRAQTKAYKIALAGSKKAGVKIFNATVGGKLEVFPRVEFEGLFSE